MRTGWTSTLAAAVLALGAMSVSAAAQYQPGDIIVAPGGNLGGSNRLIRVTPSGAVHSLRAPYLHTVFSVVPAPDNRSIWISGQGLTLPGGVFELTPDGRFATIHTRALDLIGPNEEGGIICHDPGVGVVHLHRGPAVSTAWASRTFTYHGAGIDTATGDLVIDQATYLERLTLTGPPTRTTLGTTPGHGLIRGGTIVYDPGSDLILSGSGASLPSWLNSFRIRGGFRYSTVTFFPLQYTAFNLDIDPSAGIAVLPLEHRTTGPASPRIELFDLRKARTVSTLVVGTSQRMIFPTHAVRAHSRNLAGISPAVRGNAFAALVSSPAEPGAAYVVGFSLGMRPGISVPDGRRIWLRPDALFAASLANRGIFSGCQGALDRNGEAVARMAIPRVAALAGLRFFAAAVTVSGGQVRTISAPIGVTIQ
jgi:hypothetical protein